MQDLPKTYLQYARASLADSACCHIDLDRDVVEVPAAELNDGRFGLGTMHDLAQIYHFTIDASDDEEERWPKFITLLPKVFDLLPSHAESNTQLPTTITPLVMFARLDRDGALFPDDDTPQVRIPRELLQPTACHVHIGTVDAADRGYAELKKCSSLTELLAAGLKLLQTTIGRSVDDWAPDGYIQRKHALCKSGGRKPAAKHVAKLLDLTVLQPNRRFPLYEALFRDAAAEGDAPIREGAELLRLSFSHLGQMECRYGLSRSQREALLHFLSSNGPDVVTVDGPPGTGKTTLLLSVIATQWVARALAGTQAPITVATSTNNQAVLNVLEAFAKAGRGTGIFSERWLPDIASFGLYMPARSRADLGNSKDFVVHTLVDKGKAARHSAREFETTEGFAAAEKYFVQRFAVACPDASNPTLAKAVETLRDKVRQATETTRTALEALLALVSILPTHTFTQPDIEQLIQTAEQEHARARQAHDEAIQGEKRMSELRAQWARHKDDEPWWMGALAWLGLNARRSIRDEAFCSRADLDFDHWTQRRLRNLATRTAIDTTVDTLQTEFESAAAQARRQLNETHLALTNFRHPFDKLRALFPDIPITIAEIEAALDIGPRFDAFQWATHYWEARYLCDLQAQRADPQGLGESQSPDKLERQYRRLAGLWPCFVSTLHMLPEHFRGWKVQDLPLYEAIDLLIVDEAGQVTPELASVTFTLAKRALVVGDIRQLKPIWNVSGYVDGPNALRHGVVRSAQELDAFIASGLAASCGSLMQTAQRACAFAKYPNHGRGLFLSEHRRCLPPIIAICNQMAYGNRLIPCRTDAVPKSFPTVGYVHLPGVDRMAGQSRCNDVEARAIAYWLGKHREQIEQTFAADKKAFGKLVTVLTPFTAQANLIEAHLRKTFGRRHGITVGTVHRMQGAECRVVIFSPTYGSGTRHRTRLDDDISMLNVAVSRAQDSFLVFGNMHLFQPGSERPTSHLANALFSDAANELDGLDAHLFRPSSDMGDGVLIADLAAHRAVLSEALANAAMTVTIVSPFLTSRALKADSIEQKVRLARDKCVFVRIVTDRRLNHWHQYDFELCVRALRDAGADVHIAGINGVHSKLLLVDRSWLVVGSFNWLSAVREPGSTYRRYESSLRYHGEAAFGMIERSLDDLKSLLAASAQPITRGGTRPATLSPPENP